MWKNLEYNNLLIFQKLILEVIDVNTQKTFQRCFNFVVRMVWRREVRQCQINVQTTLRMSTLKFPTLSNVESTLSISTLIWKTLDNFVKFCYFQRRAPQRSSTSKQRCENDHFQKSQKEQKNIFDQKKDNLFY